MARFRLTTRDGNHENAYPTNTFKAYLVVRDTGFVMEARDKVAIGNCFMDNKRYVFFHKVMCFEDITRVN